MTSQSFPTIRRSLLMCVLCLVVFLCLLSNCCIASGLEAQSAPPDSLTIEQAVQEALERNLGLLAERYNVTIADARIVTARLRPNPVLTLDADHQDLLGTGFNPETNNGGPVEYSLRTDFVLE